MLNGVPYGLDYVQVGLNTTGTMYRVSAWIESQPESSKIKNINSNSIGMLKRMNPNP